jgi:ubiquitin carboxyl-terminal hydrolase 8
MGVAGREESALGGNQQQDAQEFLYFLTGILEDENNMARNKKEDGAVSPQEEARYANMDRFDAAQEHWERYLQAHQSRITEKLCGITTSEKRCSNCSHFIRNFSDRWRNLTLPLLTNNDRQQLLDLFAQKFKAELLEDSPCEKCKHKNTTTRKEIFTRLPQTLILVLGRFKSVNGVSTRVSNAVEFNWNELDLTRFFAPTTSEQKAKFGLPDRHRYRCYAVVQHKGASAHRGHYTTLIRDERGSWIEMDDSTWREANPGEISSNKAYILFFEKI